VAPNRPDAVCLSGKFDHFTDRSRDFIQKTLVRQRRRRQKIMANDESDFAIGSAFGRSKFVAFLRTRKRRRKSQSGFYLYVLRFGASTFAGNLDFPVLLFIKWRSAKCCHAQHSIPILLFEQQANVPFSSAELHQRNDDGNDAIE